MSTEDGHMWWEGIYVETLSGFHTVIHRRSFDVRVAEHYADLGISGPYSTYGSENVNNN
jgi:hypothetical protein